jgi:serine/threonine protein kinase/tetratricopeptide (TPR) repeat protein
MNQPALTAKAVFDHAHEIGSPAERKAYLDEACAGDSELREKVEALLRAYEEAGSFLEKPACPPPATSPSRPGDDTTDHTPGALPETDDGQPRPDRPPRGEGPGSQVGPYRLVKLLGEGGMGAVYLAEQERPLRRQVALKIIKPGMDSEQVLARFEAERQALTLMEHPNIARVFEAGTTEQGRPYFVMELVDGVPMTRFCDEDALTPRERLALFATVCEAIQHAHAKGVIHRDVKPSNVLVAVRDGKPVPKVIDFGLAKATEQPLTEHSQLTQVGSVVGTLDYMSPEQADSGGRGVDTRTDVYSLGVMLYELLTGTTPLDRPVRPGEGLFDVLMRILEEEPPRPSARVLALGERLPAVARGRKTEPARLARLLRGEVDWIVMKALEKDPERRYETASGFAKDVRRYFDDEPVEACPPSARYRLGKFARKHRTLLATAGGFVALLVLGVVGLTWGIFEVDNARKREVNERQRAVKAENVMRQALYMNDAVIQVVARNRPNLGEREKTFLRNLLREYGRFPPEPGVSEEDRARTAEWHLRLAENYAFIRERAEAELGYRRAIQLYEELVDAFPSVPGYRYALARSTFNLAVVLQELGKGQDAEAGYLRAIDLHNKLTTDFPANSVYRRDLADDLNNLGTLFRSRQELGKAEKVYRQAVALGEKLILESPDYRIHLAAAYHNLGNAVRDQGNAGASLAWYGKALQVLIPMNPRSADASVVIRNACWDRANALGQLGRHAEACKDWQRAIALDGGSDRPHLQLFLAAEQVAEKLQAESKPSGQQLFAAAALYARAAAAAKAAEEPGLQKRYASRALGLLKQAGAAGWFGEPGRIEQLKQAKEFAALPAAEFKAFLDGLNAGKDPKGPPGTK